MSNETQTGPDAGYDTDPKPIVTVPGGVSLTRERIVVWAGVLSLVAVAATTLVDVLRNLPFDPIVVPSAVRSSLALTTPLVVAVALVAVAVASERPTVRVGLLFAGVFGLLGVVQRAATLPAVIALTAGGLIALVGSIYRPATYRDVRLTVIGSGVVGAIGVSLASTVGIIDGGFQSVGGLLALGTLTALVVRAEGDRVALAAGFAAFAATVIASIASPFVVGSVLLVGFAAVGVPHVLAALAVGSGIALAVAGVRRREFPVVAGAGLVVLAGVPVTFPRAMAFLLGATLVLLETNRLVTPDEEVSA